MIRLALLLAVLATPALADAVTVTRPVRAGEVVSADMLGFADASTTGPAAGAVSDPRDAIGLEARVNLYPGRPLLARDVGPPTVVERNAIVSLVFRRGGLVLRTEGRAMGRAGAGEVVRVINLSSRQTVSGVATAAGTVDVN